MLELLIVLTVSGIIYAIAIPQIGNMRALSALRADRLELSSAFAFARSAALQKGKTATLTLSGNQATVSVNSGLNGTPVQIYGPIKFDQTLASTLSVIGSAPTSISFDARGLVTPVPNGVTKYRFVNRTFADTLCVSASGRILPRGCQL